MHCIARLDWSTHSQINKSGNSKQTYIALKTRGDD